MKQPSVELRLMAQAGKPLRNVLSSNSPFGRVAYMPATLGSSSRADECRMPRNDRCRQRSPPPHRLRAVTEQQIDVAAMPAQIAALP